jgi:hypothetical protein
MRVHHQLLFRQLSVDFASISQVSIFFAIVEEKEDEDDKFAQLARRYATLLVILI